MSCSAWRASAELRKIGSAFSSLIVVVCSLLPALQVCHCLGPSQGTQHDVWGPLEAPILSDPKGSYNSLLRDLLFLREERVFCSNSSVNQKMSWGKCWCTFINLYSRREIGAGVFFVFFLKFVCQPHVHAFSFEVAFWMWPIIAGVSQSMQMWPHFHTAGLIAALPPTPGFNRSALCGPSIFLPHIPLGQKDMRASENRTQKCCPVFNSVVPVLPATYGIWELTRFLPLKKKQTNKPNQNCYRRRCSCTAFLLGPLDKATIAEELRMMWKKWRER